MEYRALAKSDLDVTDGYATEHCIHVENPDVVLHCAAFTDVDTAESERNTSIAVNAGGASNVAEACRAVRSQMVFFGTDYVFDGTKRTPYSINDKPDPVSAYGESKLAGENAVVASGVDALLIRTSWLYGAVGGNFVRTVIQRAREGRPLQLVDDQTGSPTWAEHVAELTLDLVNHRASGTYHVTNSGEATWYDLGREALSISGLHSEIEPISTEDWGAPAPRPRYSVLDSSKVEAFLGRKMTPWREALKKFLKDIPR
jgi:dTDP-4-dehydrorhamnose reductase